MDETLYPKWVEYANRYLNGHESILELACGTGRLGVLLKQVGYDVTGLDSSADMLSLAYNRQREAGVSFPLIEGDMRELAELEKYDAILSFCDSLCYLEEKTDLEKVFSQVYQVLNNDGIFLFDVHSLKKMKQFEEYSYHAETEEAVLLWDSFKGDAPHSVEHELTIFVKNDEGLYERYQELHKERTYPIEEYHQMLSVAGFKEIEVTADFKDTLESDALRWFFKAKK
jgi:SAM-dependent methyltransferase